MKSTVSQPRWKKNTTPLLRLPALPSWRQRGTKAPRTFPIPRSRRMWWRSAARVSTSTPQAITRASKVGPAAAADQASSSPSLPIKRPCRRPANAPFRTCRSWRNRLRAWPSTSSYNGLPWTTVGGTSLATPCWAGLIAIANQGRVAAGKTVLDSGNNPTQAVSVLYNLAASHPQDFHSNLDAAGITNGTNLTGLVNPGTYDEQTGLGSPVPQYLIPDLIAQPSLASWTVMVYMDGQHFPQRRASRVGRDRQLPANVRHQLSIERERRG